MATITAPEKLTLSNGMPVVLQHAEGLVASTYWWVRTGSADERPQEAGYAHFLEHMLFKDAGAKETGQPSSGKMAQAIEGAGGDINAYTSFDQTVYHVTCAEHHWEKILDIFGPMAKPQRFLKSDFEREREVILEELRKNEDSPDRQFFQKIFSTSFSRHPYGRPVIGTVRSLKAATVSSLEGFYRRQYCSGQMGLVVVGPLEDPKRKAALIKKLEKHYGSGVIPKRAAPTNTRPGEQELRSGLSVGLKAFDVKTPRLALSFRVPGLGHARVPQLDLMNGILGMGETSRLYQKLFHEKSLVTEVGSGLYIPKDPGIFYIYADYSDLSKTQTVLEAALAEVDRIQKEAPTQSEMDRIIANEEAEKLYATQSTDGLAGRLGFLEYVMGDLNFDRSYLDRLKNTTAEDIKNAACDFMDPRRLGVVLMHSDKETPPTEKDLKQWIESRLKTSAASKGQTKPKGKSKGPDIHRFKMPSGLRGVYLYRPHSNVIGVHASTLGGVRLETEGEWGIHNLASSVWAKGTRQKTSQEISQIVEGMASGLDGFSGRNSLGLELTTLGKYWGKMSDLFLEIFTQPNFPEIEIEHGKRVVLDHFKTLEDHSAQLCSKLFLETLFESHPYRHLVMGTPETVESFQSSHLLDHWKKTMRPDQWVLSVVGAAPWQSVENWFEQIESEMKRIGAPSKEGAAVQLSPEPTLKAPRWVTKNLKREQIHLMVGGLGTSIYSEDRFALRILQNLLGGQSGRLFIELREKKSLAYTVAPMSFEGMEPGYVATYIACSPSKKDEAIAGIRKVLESVVKKKISPKELQRAKEFYLGRRAMELQGDSSLSAHYGLRELYGTLKEDESEFVKSIEKVSEKQVREVCEKYFLKPHQVTVVVG